MPDAITQTALLAQKLDVPEYGTGACTYGRLQLRRWRSAAHQADAACESGSCSLTHVEAAEGASAGDTRNDKQYVCLFVGAELAQAVTLPVARAVRASLHAAACAVHLFKVRVSVFNLVARPVPVYQSSLTT